MEESVIRELDDVSLVDLFVRVLNKPTIVNDKNEFVKAVINNFSKEKIIEIIKKYN